MVSSPSVAGSAAEPRAEQWHRDAQALDEHQRAEHHEDDQSPDRLPVELEMDAGGGADEDQREQRNNQTGGNQQQAEHHVGPDHVEGGLPCEASERLAWLDERSDHGNQAEKHEQRAQHRREVPRAHARRPAKAIVDGDVVADGAECDVKNPGSEVLRIANDACHGVFLLRWRGDGLSLATPCAPDSGGAPPLANCLLLAFDCCDDYLDTGAFCPLRVVIDLTGASDDTPATWATNAMK